MIGVLTVTVNLLIILHISLFILRINLSAIRILLSITHFLSSVFILVDPNSGETGKELTVPLIIIA